MCSQTNPPRISFSDDLRCEDGIQMDQNERRRDTKLLDFDNDFEFSISNGFDHESSFADEIFSDGMILPLQIQQNLLNVSPKHHHHQQSTPSLPPRPRPPSFDNEKKDKCESKSFWQFRRSSSLNCDIKKKSLICSLSILSRSNSTSSVPNPKQTKLKEIQRLSQQATSMSKPCCSSYVYTLPQNIPYRYGGSHHGNGVRISPVLNVAPPPYITRGTANLFGFGSFLVHGNDKKKKIK